MSQNLIRRFKPGTWIQDWPHKINLDDHPTIVASLKRMAEEANPIHPRDTPQIYRDRLLEWRYKFIDQLGNDIFLECDRDSREGWVVFHSDEDALQFILTHS